MKKGTIYNRLLLMGIGAMMSVSTAYALYDTSLTYSACSLGIYPYNPTGTVVGEFANQWFNLFEAINDPTCAEHLSYPNQYSPQPPLSTDTNINLKNAAGIDNIKAEKAQHNHTYHNASKEDTASNGFYYQSVMDRFQIILENDTLTKTYSKTGEAGFDLVCVTPRDNANGGGFANTVGCSGTLPDWGGTEITYNSTSGVAQWKFGTSGSGRPWFWGNNPSLGEEHGYYGLGVKLKSKNNPEEIWSATTTSRVLIRDLAMQKNTGNADTAPFCDQDGQPGATKDYNGNWCTMDPPGITGVEGTVKDTSTNNKQYYWYRIGVVGTVWKKPTSEAKVCSNLTLDILQNGQHYSPANVTGLQPNTPMTLTVAPSFSGTGTTDPILHYAWSTTPNTQPASGLFKDSQTSSAPGTNPFTDGNNDTVSYYTGGVPLTKVIIDAYEGTDKQDPCHQEFIIPEAPPSYICDYVELTPNTVNPPTVNGGETNYTATVHFKDNNSNPVTIPFNTTLQWNGTNGTFLNGLTNQNQIQMSNTDFLNTFTSTNVPASVTARITNIIGAQNSTNCQNGVSVNTPPEGEECDYINVYSSGGNPLDVNEASLLWGDGVNTDNTQVTHYNWSTTEGSFIHTPYEPVWCAAYPFSNYPAACKPFFTGGTDGTVITVRAIGTNVADCIKTITVEGPPPSDVDCEYIEHIEPSDWELNANGDTDLKVRVHYDDGNSYNTHVLWTGSDGNYNGNTSSNQTHTSTNTFSETFTSTSDNSSANVRVTEFWDAENVRHNVTTGACAAGLKIETPEYECEDITPIYNHGQVCLLVEGGYDGSFSWDTDGDGTVDLVTNSPYCADIEGNTEYEVYATDEPANDACRLKTETPEQPPELEKRFSTNGNNYRTGTVTIPATQEKVYYQLTFKPNSPMTSATITDTISETGYLLAELLPANAANAPEPGRINYNNDMKVFEQGYGELENCSDIDFEEDPLSHCYTGDIGDPSGVRLVRVDGKITITYTGKVESALEDPDVCISSDVCQEKYRNRASAREIIVWLSDDEYIEFPPVYSDEIVVQIFCQYILTRAAGDIFLETDLNAGVDILMCSRYRSSTGIIITPGQPDTPEIVSTGAGDTEIFTIGHEICTQGQAGQISGALSTLYGQSVVKNLSSQICEVRLRTGSPWKQKVITNSIDENKTRISRWEPMVKGIGSSLGSLVNQYPDEPVYHVKGGDLTVLQEFTLADGEYPGQGAKTFIVEDGNLIINKNILYGTCNKIDGTQCTVRDIGSLAFIVINGNIYIDKEVQKLAGVFYVQEGDIGTGKLYSGTFSGGNYTTQDLSTKKLTVNGSVYGDIDPLFTYRAYAGDPALEEGGIVIRFDERVILNTPPGLRDVLNLSQSEVAR